MTTYIAFTPPISTPSTYVVQLGSVFFGSGFLPYKLIVKWNVSAQRLYYDLYDYNGVWVVTAPLIATAPGIRVTDIFYNRQMRSIRITLQEPPVWHQRGQMIDWSLAGVDPAALNGTHRCENISEDQFMFYTLDDPLKTIDPGPIVQRGSAHRYHNLVAGYIPGATMIFRNDRFEIF